MCLNFFFPLSENCINYYASEIFSEGRCSENLGSQMKEQRSKKGINFIEIK